MKYPVYQKYKRSGVKWLGDVPEHWEVKRLRYLAQLRNDKTETDEETSLPYVGMENIESWTGRLLALNGNVVPTGISNRFRAGALLFGKLRPYLAKACIVDFSGLCSSELLVLESQPRSSRFFLYQLLSDGFISLVDSTTYGAKMPRASWDFIGDCQLTAPPQSEQVAIADFLDAETTKLDTLVAKKRELIEKLKEKRVALISRTVTRGLPPEAARAAGLSPNPKLKPSGIEWLGDIPEHWETPPLYTRYSIELGKMLDESRITGNHLVPYLRNVDVQWDAINTSDLPEMDIREDEYSRYTLSAGDLLVCEGGEAGRAAIFQQFTSILGFQKALHRLRAIDSDDLPRFLYYMLYWASHFGIFLAEGNPNTIPHLTGEKLRRYRFPKPPLPEQLVIADYLDRETSKIDRMVEKVAAAIERLQEYRTALITAAVTGKIDVRKLAA